MQYRKKPIIVEAYQYFPNKKNKGVFYEELSEGFKPYVTTIHNNDVPICIGDWIIPEPDGIHFYPVKPDIFAETYEQVD